MSDSQQFMQENDPQRVNLRYKVKIDNAEKTVEIPFITGVMADLMGETEPVDIEQRQFHDVSAATIDQYMAQLAPTLNMTLPNELTQEGDLSVQLKLQKLKDFHPDEIVKQVPALRELIELRAHLMNLKSHLGGKPKAAKWIRQQLEQLPQLTIESGQVSEDNNG